ncbi:MAG TPA: fluoride efflux transporter CrcB [Verrucomicrobiae bacterium]|nr:fluoride efflux transporter CrcB [Verrucomicrobiae bacterium]
MIAIWVSLAGGVGAVARFVLDGHIRSRDHRRYTLPWGTTLINASGSLVLGVLTGLVLYHHTSASLKLILGTGFCGGYTTFSTASFETVRLFEERRVSAAYWHLVTNVSLTLSLAALGLWIAH